MAAAITDLITRVTDNNTGSPVISSLAAPGKALGATSVNITDATNWSTAAVVYFSIYTTKTVGSAIVKDETSQTDYKGVLAGTTLNNIVLTGGTDRTYTAGAIVEQTATSRYAKDMYDLLISFANQDGSLKTSAVQAALNISNSAPADWTALATTPTVTASNGQKEYTLTYSGVNYTDRLQPGTKIRIPRTGTTPTQSMNFTAASSQYATKTSPSGITFTNTFTVEALINPTSYNPNTGGIITRDVSGTNGFGFRVLGTGQISLYFGSGSQYTDVLSYPTIKLNDWTHVAAVISSVSTRTVAIYINGTLVPTYYASTNSAALTQGGPLQIGALSGANFFDGGISEARIWSTAQTATQIQNNMGISLTGNETGLVGLFQGNGNFNDKTANANNLTATNGATATQASNPFSSIEFGIYTDVQFTGGNTVTKVFSGPYYVPNATLGATSYSNARTPYGFNATRGKWSVTTIDMSQTNTTYTANGWAQLGKVSLTVPTGAWQLSYRLNFFGDLPSAAINYSNLSYAANSGTPISYILTGISYTQSGGALISLHAASDTINVNTQTPIYMNVGSSATGNGIKAYVSGTNNPGGVSITAECAYI